MSTVYTVGHSTHELDYFINLLKPYSIDILIDVRSMPASSYNPQYNKEPFSYFLKENNIKYLHFGNEFGARHDDDNYLDKNGVVDFEKYRESYQFQSGIDRLDIGISNGHKIVLMCSEGDPLDCHRFSMISVHLEEIGIGIKHIMKDNTLLSHTELEKELIKKYDRKLPKPDLFNQNIGAKDQLKKAYELHNKEIGWKNENKNFGEF
jgi:uncharacterized protein (DUF488 family)